jgi:4-hydroxybenzoate polyprenyltransferase
LRTALSAILVTSFRIWDDLADRDYDRVHHPARVLVRSPAARWFWVLIVGLAVVSACILAAFGGPQPLPIYTGLIVALAVVYHGPRQLRYDRFAHTQLVLIKYPVFIALLTAQGFSSQVVLAGALAYLLMSIYEWRDDPAFRGKYLSGRIAVVSAVGLIVAVSLGKIYG